MNAVEIIEQATWDLEHNKITLGEYDERIEPLKDVRPNIHARWIPITDSYYEDGTVKESHWECSKCGSCKSGWGEFKFCPDCGADMREPKDIIHKAIDNTIFAEEAYPNIKEELHKAVDMAEPKGEKGTE